jgi:fructose-bisphosphate aldolase class 1
VIVTTPGLGDSISGSILYDETIRQRAQDGHDKKPDGPILGNHWLFLNLDNGWCLIKGHPTLF